MAVVKSRDTGWLNGSLRIAVIAVMLAPSVAIAKATEEGLSNNELAEATHFLKQALAGPKERAFLQILAEVIIERDPSDTLAVYDLVVRYDPDRYRDPHVGVYPLTYMDQFIAWGKRIALFTRATKWRSRRFYLHDLSTGRQSWMFTADARQVYPGTEDATFPTRISHDSAPEIKRWLKIIRMADPATEPMMMSRWFRLINEGSRDQVIHETIRAQQLATPNPASAR